MFYKLKAIVVFLRCISNILLLRNFGDLQELFNKNESEPPTIGSIEEGPLSWADDTALLSESNKGI